MKSLVFLAKRKKEKRGKHEKKMFAEKSMKSLFFLFGWAGDFLPCPDLAQKAQEPSRRVLASR